MAAEWTIRVLKPDGTVITNDLPHLTSNFQKWAYQSGLNAPTAGIGRATVPLHPPESGEYKLYAAVYSQITLYCRFEIYFGKGIGEKRPRFAGLVDRLPSADNAYSLEGPDSWQRAQYSQRFLSWLANVDAAVGLRKWGLSYYTLFLHDKDFSDLGTTWATSTGVFVDTNTGRWTQGTVEGRTGAMFISSSAGGNASTAATRSSAPLSTESLRESFVAFNLTFVLPPRALVSGISNSAFFFMYLDGAGIPLNGWSLMDLTVNWLNTPQSQVTVDASIGESVAPYLTRVNGIPVGVLDDDSKAVIRLQMHLLTYTQNGAVNTQLYINGQEVGAVVIGAPLADIVDAAITFGAQAYDAAINSIPGVQILVDSLTILSEAPIFAEGSIAAPVITVTPPEHNFSKPTILDVQHVFASQEGWSLRCTPAVAPALDVIDMGPAIGATTGIRFAIGDNAKDLHIEPNLQATASLQTIVGSGGGGNGISYISFSKEAYDLYGLVCSQVNWEDASSMGTLREIGDVSIANATSSGVAKSFTVIDDVTEVGLDWRELDYVILHDPKQGVVEQMVQVIGYTCTEGTDEVAVIADQYPITHAKAHAHKLRAQLDNALSGASRAHAMSREGHMIIDPGLMGVRIERSTGAGSMVAGPQLLDPTKFGIQFYDENGNAVKFLVATGTPPAGTAEVDLSG